jgi:hypothetical protein
MAGESLTAANIIEALKAGIMSGHEGVKLRDFLTAEVKQAHDLLAIGKFYRMKKTVTKDGATREVEELWCDTAIGESWRLIEGLGYVRDEK